MSAPAQRIAMQRPSPACNAAGSCTRSRYSRTAAEVRKDGSGMASREPTDVSWRVLGGGGSGMDLSRPSRSFLRAFPFAFFRCFLS